MRLAGDLEKTADPDPTSSFPYCVSASVATVGRTVSTMEASSASRSARAGRAAKAFRGFKYPNEIGPDVQDIHSPRVPTLDEMHDLSPLLGIDSMTRRSGSARTLMQLVRQNPRLDIRMASFSARATRSLGCSTRPCISANLWPDI
jgi:Cobalamin-independent synthase, Catalytic domain